MPGILRAFLVRIQSPRQLMMRQSKEAAGASRYPRRSTTPKLKSGQASVIVVAVIALMLRLAAQSANQQILAHQKTVLYFHPTTIEFPEKSLI